MKNIGKNIRSLRRNLGIYQWELAEMVGCTQAHISGIEHGKELSIPLLIKISKALGCQLNDIMK